MDPAIIAARCTPPPPPRAYLARPRLDAVWDGLEATRLLLVTAGAGYGKTSWLAANARRGDRPVAWLTLDEQDADPACFAPHLLHAVRPGLESAVADLDAGAPDLLPRALATLVGELHDDRRGRVIVLDDVHAPGHGAETTAFFGRLARYLPAACTLVLAGREPVAGRAMKLRGTGVVADLEAADLALDADEIAALHALHGLGDLDPEAAAAVASRTEGWPAGVEILLHATAAVPHDATALAAAIDDVGAEGWFSYFAEEVLGRLDDDVRGFLLRSSVLPELECDLVDAVLERDDSRRLLSALARRRLFTIRLDGRGRRYRFHHLFRDVLRRRLDDVLPAGEVRALHRRAAAELGGRGAWSEALAAAAAAGDHALALRLAEHHGEDLLAAGRFESVRAALTAVPRDRLARRSRALTTLGRAHEALGAWDEAERVYRRALRSASSGRRRVETMARIARIKLRRGESRPCIKLCRDALAEPGRIDGALRGDLQTMLGVACCDMGRLDRGERHLDQALAAFGTRAPGEETARRLYLLETNLLYRRGDFQAAKTAVRRALGAFRRRGDALNTCHCLGVLAHITADGCEVREARELAFECLRMAESLEYHLMTGYARLALGQCATVTGDHERAHDHVRRAADLGERLGEQGLSGLPLIALAENARLRGRVHEARKLVRRVLDEAARRDDVYLEVRALTLQGRLDHRRRRVEARRLWDRAARIAARVGMGFDRNRLDVVRALHDPEPARAGRLAADLVDDGHEFLLTTVERPEAPALLADALRDAEHADVAARLIEEIGDEAADALAPLLDDDVVAPRAREVLARLDGPRSRALLGETATRDEGADAADAPPLRIRAMGQLVVETDGRRLTMREWRSARALRLFQMLLTRRFRWVPVEVVLETLWPDAEPKKGRNNLRQTIHMLRRTLQPDLETPRSSCYVRHHRDALRLDPGEGYDYDLEACEDALDEAEVAWSERRPDDAREALARAGDLYAGPFLEESPYEEFAVLEGERIRDRLLRNLERLARTLDAGRDWHELVPLSHRILTLDPYQESAHASLVKALAELGHRREALAAYERYETVMVRELDLLPSPRMKTLAESLASR